MSGNHHKTVCSCGAVISQCRCPSPDKTVKVVERGCQACHNQRYKEAVEAMARGERPWAKGTP